MSVKNNEESIRIGLEAIKVLRFNVSDLGLSEDEFPAYEDVDVDMSFNFKDLGDDKFQVFLHYAMSLEFEQTKLELLHADVAFQFFVFDLNKKLNSARDHVMMTTISVAFSTLRGIVFERSKGFNVNKLILPIINPKEFWENMKTDIEAEKK